MDARPGYEQVRATVGEVIEGGDVDPFGDL